MNNSEPDVEIVMTFAFSLPYCMIWYIQTTHDESKIHACNYNLAQNMSTECWLN